MSEPVGEPFRSVRSARFYYAHEAIHAIENENCSKGCKIGQEAGGTEDAPGGSCEVLIEVILEADSIPDLLDDGLKITCTKRVPLEPDQESAEQVDERNHQ